jgi:uncharacterized integral membrane protein
VGLIPRRVDREGLKEFQPRLWLILVGLLLLAAYVIAFVLANRNRVAVHFVFFTARVSLIWLILLSLGIGFLGGVLLSQLYRRRGRVRLGRLPQQPPGQGADDLGKPDDAGVDVTRSHGAEREPH